MSTINKLLVVLFLSVAMTVPAYALDITTSIAVPRKMDQNNVSIILGGFSEHFGSDGYCYEGQCYDDYNETNPAFGIEYNNAALVVMENSFYKTSVALYFTIRPNFAKFKYTDFGLRIGAVSGYEDTPVGLPVTLLTEIVAELRPFEEIDGMRRLKLELGAYPCDTDEIVGTLNFKWDL